MRVKELFMFIRERERIRIKKESGTSPPGTKDAIFQRYRFCCVRREDDKVTRWIRENWREPNADDPNLFFAMVVARLLNLPASLAVVGYPVPWNPPQFKKILRKRKESGERVFSGAYMIHADAKDGWLKTDYLAERVLKPMWAQRTALRPRKEDTLRSFHERLMTCRDMGSFMAGQVTVDCKFAEPLKSATDWWTWCCLGPGSERGLNRICGQPVKERWKPEAFRGQITLLQTKLDPLLREAGMKRISGSDVTNVLCEMDKYLRAKNGEGRPKQLYPGT